MFLVNMLLLLTVHRFFHHQSEGVWSSRTNIIRTVAQRTSCTDSLALLAVVREKPICTHFTVRRRSASFDDTPCDTCHSLLLRLFSAVETFSNRFRLLQLYQFHCSENIRTADSPLQRVQWLTFMQSNVIYVTRTVRNYKQIFYIYLYTLCIISVCVCIYQYIVNILCKYS